MADVLVRPGTSLVEHVGADAARAGLQVGAHLDLSAVTFAQQLQYRFGVGEGAFVDIPVVEGQGVRLIRIPATQRVNVQTPWLTSFSEVCAIFSLLLATYLSFHKPSARFFALTLFLGGSTVEFPSIAVLFSTAPDVVYIPITLLMYSLCASFPVLVLSSFAIRIGDRATAVARRATWVVDATVLVGLMAFAPVREYFGQLPYTIAATAVLLTAALLGSWFANPADRARSNIVVGAILLGGVGYGVVDLLFNLRVANYLTFVFYINFSIILVPLVIVYSIVRYRVFDLAFLVSRAVVYAIMSALLFVSFAVIEFFIERFLTTLSNVESIAIDLVIALAVVLAGRLLHARIDRVINIVLFRSRYDAEAALRRFSKTARFYTAECPLFLETMATLKRYGGVEGVAIYLARGTLLERRVSSFESSPLTIDADDPIVVDLRAHGEPLSAPNAESAFPTGHIYPMMLAGRLVGAICTGEREGGEAMPPDVDATIARIADAVAITLSAIESDIIRDENQVLRARLDELGRLVPPR